MNTPLSQPDSCDLARLEARALERMARALREHAAHLLASARSRGALVSREASFQVEVFAERCAIAGELLDSGEAPPLESRLARLERLVSALECSRGYFMSLQQAA